MASTPVRRVGDLVGEPGERAVGGGAEAVLVDDRLEGGVAVEGRAAQAGGGGNGGFRRRAGAGCGPARRG